MGSFGELSKVCSQIVLKCLYFGSDKRSARYSKTLILQETLKTQNPLQVNSYAFSEVEHLCQQVGCARHRHAGLRMDGTPALHLGDLVIEVFHSPPNQINKSKDQESQETCRGTPHSTNKTKMRRVSRTHRVVLWIGCLIELIWIPRFKLGTSTPNINSQTY